MRAKEKIKVLFFIGSYGTGGKERQLAELIKGLPSEHYEIHMFVKSDGAHYLDDIKEKLTSFYSLDRARFGRKAFRNIIQHINKVNPHIIHSWADTTSFYAAFARSFVKNKYILIDGSIRMAPLRLNYLSLISFQRKIINAFSDIVVANSKAGLKSFHVPARKSHCIYNGFDFKRLSYLKDPGLVKSELGIETKHVVGMVARFDHEKDWPTYISAAEMMLESRHDVTFLAVGGGADINKFMDQVSSKYKNRFIFTGERNDVESIVNVFDIGILASYSEGISNSIIEYMALAKPVITSGSGGITELVVQNETGYIFPVGNKEALYQFIIMLLDDKPLRMSMGESAKKRINEVFSFEKMVLAYNQLYQSVACAE